MEILARRLTIITLLMAVFAIMLAAAVEADYRRSQQNHRYGSLADCTTPDPCRANI